MALITLVRRGRRTGSRGRTADADEHFNLPRDRTVIMGSRIDLREPPW